MARESLSRIPAANMLETIAQKRNVEMLRSSAETDTIVFSQQFEVLEAIERVLLHSGHIAQRSPGWIQPAVDEKAVLEPTTDEKAVLEPTADEKAA
jgi:hypothetical protein